jgi:hypothetical protein
MNNYIKNEAHKEYQDSASYALRKYIRSLRRHTQVQVSNIRLHVNQFIDKKPSKMCYHCNESFNDYVNHYFNDCHYTRLNGRITQHPGYKDIDSCTTNQVLLMLLCNILEKRPFKIFYFTEIS